MSNTKKNTHPLRHRRRLPGKRRTFSLHQLPIVNETSAGGVIVEVRNNRAYVALIARRARNGNLEWCLPKGHLEGEETAAEAAAREISEETGIHGRVLCHLNTIDYWFSGTDRRVHKVVHHFLLEALSGEITVLNDPDQEAELAEWVALEEVAERLAYDNEKRIIEAAQELLIGEKE